LEKNKKNHCLAKKWRGRRLHRV